MTSNRSIPAFSRLLVFGLLLGASAMALALGRTDDEQRTKIRTQSKEVLARLYAVSPGARNIVKNSAGYATFSNFGLKLGLAGGGQGKGLAVNNGTGKEIFMRFVEAQAGLGLGIKKYDIIFIFDNPGAMSKFVDQGWEYGGEATAAAKLGEKGKAYEGALSVSPGVWMYQNTESGLALEMAVKGSKYFKSKDLN